MCEDSVLRGNISKMCTKIPFGKTFSAENKLLMPISANAHHGLVDGKHVAEFFVEFQHLLNR